MFSITGKINAIKFAREYASKNPDANLMNLMTAKELVEGIMSTLEIVYQQPGRYLVVRDRCVEGEHNYFSDAVEAGKKQSRSFSVVMIINDFNPVTKWDDEIKAQKSAGTFGYNKNK